LGLQYECDGITGYYYPKGPDDSLDKPGLKYQSNGEVAEELNRSREFSFDMSHPWNGSNKTADFQELFDRFGDDAGKRPMMKDDDDDDGEKK
jgi:hypothetical protein